MNRPIASKPIQAGDYGKNVSSAPINYQERQAVVVAQTDGQKTLSLWAR